jgi:hypothetical protein
MAFREHGVILDTSVLMQLPARFEEAVERALNITVEQGVHLAKRHAHVITGAMRAGVYGATSKKSGYSDAVMDALSANPKNVILPEVGKPNPGEAVISDVTLQSIFEEFGTASRGPHAFLQPMATMTEGLFVSNLEREVARELK